MRSAVWLLLAAVACGPKGPPAAPAYTPVNSPEAETSCKSEWQAAKAAREQLVETDSGDSRIAAAGAVFAQAECERRHFDSLQVTAPSQEAMVGKLRAARTQYFNARNLYEEVGNYQILRWRIGANSRLGELNGAFADKLRKAPAPADLAEPGERGTFLAELSKFAQVYDGDAVIAHVDALAAAAAADSLVRSDSDVEGWVQSSCLALSYLDAATHQNQKLCSDRM